MVANEANIVGQSFFRVERLDKSKQVFQTGECGKVIFGKTSWKWIYLLDPVGWLVARFIRSWPKLTVNGIVSDLPIKYYTHWLLLFTICWVFVHWWCHSFCQYKLYSITRSSSADQCIAGYLLGGWTALRYPSLSTPDKGKWPETA